MVVQTYQNDNIGATTLGYASVNSFDTGIYEFAWGGGTYPEIAGGGAVKLSQILNVDTTSSVGIISPLTDYFSGVVDQDLPANSQPQFTQYSTTANIPNTALVMTTEFGVPTISNFMVSTDVTAITAGFGGNSTLTFANNVSRVTTNSSGFYITGSTIPNLTMSMEISNSLASGDKWYVTLYENLPNPFGSPRRNKPSYLPFSSEIKIPFPFRCPFTNSPMYFSPSVFSKVPYPLALPFEKFALAL